MRPLAGWLTALSLMCNLTLPVNAEADGAKGLFYEQLEHPTAQMNTGVQYWIELLRDGVTTEANNKSQFQSGDKIRFHVKPNIDGFAYILLKSGSRGEQAQLFPIASRKENNQINRGEEIILPSDGVLTFDSNPGTEKLSLIISRKKIDTEAYMSKDSSPPRIAMSSSGSKDLIPNQVLVSYISTTTAPMSAPSRVETKTGSGKNQTPEAKTPPRRGAKMVSLKALSESHADTHSDTPKIASAPASTVKTETETTAAPPTKVDNRHKVATGKSAQPAPRKAVAHVKPVAATKSVVTVVNTDPSAVFAADISLEHI